MPIVDQQPMKVLANRVYMLRHGRRMSQQELARAVGCSPVTISNLEQQKLKTLTIDNLVSLARVFDVTVDYLLGRDEEH
jgi:transcriptional regulator with XRE-family HTH domain